MHLQRLKLVHKKVEEEMNLQENFLFAQYPLHHVTYSVTKFEVATSNGLQEIHLKENTLFDL